MKTFKLQSLQIIENVADEIVKHPVPLHDGLIINREDEANRWLIEAYVEATYKDFFTELSNNNEEIMVEVVITKEDNAPATFITSIIGINDIGGHINVLFLGNIVDKQKSKIEEMLSDLIDKGYQGEELLTTFKKLI
ncbi:YwpF-like family protein [Ornithinibacillus salinisoli]|uniref:YwpF-like family protein n=1 Tax=Ornithinibacillus salinisoli TaxID=1848459 RepID=A0ABW4VWM7_9BACI